MNMPDRFAHVHGDEDALPELTDAELKEGLEDVVDTIMCFGEFPQPRTSHDLFRRPVQRRLFDLQEWLVENWTTEDLANFVSMALTDFGLDFDERRLAEADRVSSRLKEELKDADFVEDRAFEMVEGATL